MKNSVSPSVVALHGLLLGVAALMASTALADNPGQGAYDAPAASSGGFSTSAGVQTGSLGAAPTGVDAATTGSVNPKAGMGDLDTCKDANASDAPNADAAKAMKEKCKPPHYETAMGMMTDPNTPVADTKPATGALPKLADLDMLKTTAVKIPQGANFDMNTNRFSDQLSIMNKTAPTMSNVNFSGYDSLAAPQQVQTTSLGGAEIQAMRNAEGRSNIILGGQGIGFKYSINSQGQAVGASNGKSIVWDDSIVKTGTEVANTMNFHQPSAPLPTDSLGNVTVPASAKGLTSQQIDMASYVDQRGIDLGKSAQVRQIAISTALRESAMNTMVVNPDSSVVGLGQNTVGNWLDNTKKFYGDGAEVNRNNTNNQIDMLFNTTQSHVDEFNNSAALQSKYGNAGAYDYAKHYAGEFSMDSNGNGTNSTNASRINYAVGYYNDNSARGNTLFNTVDAGGSDAGSVVSKPGYTGGGNVANTGGGLGGIVNAVTGGGIHTGNSTIDNVVNGVIGGKGTNLAGMLNTGGTQLSSSPLLGAVGGGQSTGSGSTGSTDTTGTTTRPVTVNIDKDTSTVTEVTTKDGVKTTAVTKTDNTGKVLESITTTEEKVADADMVTKVTVKDGVKTTTVTKTDSTGKVLETTTKTEKVDAVASTDTSAHTATTSSK